MTLLVELTTYSRQNNGVRDQWSTSLIRTLYDTLPSTSPLCQYAVKTRAAYQHPGEMTKKKYEKYPQSFLIDLLMIAVPMKGLSILRNIKEELSDPCNFHEHKGDKKAIAVCKMRQQKERLWFASFLRACMSEVYDMEEAMLKAKSHAQTEEKSEHLADMPEKKDHAAMPFSASVGLPSNSTFSFTISRGVDAGSEMGPPVSNWEDLEAYDDYEILLHGG